VPSSALIELRFIKFNLASTNSRAYQTLEVESAGGSCPSQGSTTTAALWCRIGAVERSESESESAHVDGCVPQWSPALQAGPLAVLIRQFHPSPRTRGCQWEGFLVHILEVLDDDLYVEFGRHHLPP
jgi:hypothetical protein